MNQFADQGFYKDILLVQVQANENVFVQVLVEQES
jgi:hypothetical protein